MATLQNIRKRGPLVAIVVGLALLAFVLGDAIRSGSSIFSSSRNQIGEVYGEAVTIQEYQQEVSRFNELYQMRSGGTPPDAATSERLRQQAWEQVVRNHIMNKELSELGLGVHSDELFDLIQGEDIDPSVKQLFTDPQTGEVNRSQIINFLKNFDQVAPRDQQYWLQLEQQIQERRLIKKYNNLVSKGLYANSLQVKNNLEDQKYVVDFKFVTKAYKDVPDNEISISDDELQSHYEETKDKYEQEASRDIVYIPFEIVPSPEDRKAAENYIATRKEKFAKAKDDADFVKLHADSPFDWKHYAMEDMPVPDEMDSIFFYADTGYVYGPYFEDEAFKMAKVSEIKIMPDSVKARHILIQPGNAKTQNIQSMERAKEFADSLKNIVEQSQDTMLFAQLVQRYSADQGSISKGGVYDWFEEGKMVKPFNDSVFYGETGDIMLAESQFGVHIIEILAQGPKNRRVQVAIVDKKLVPSKETRDKIYQDASSFIAKNNTAQKFSEAADKQGLTKRIAAQIKEGDAFVTGLNSARELVRWAYKAEKYQVSPVFEIEDRFVVAILTEIREEGIAPLEQVRDAVTQEIRKKKKAEKLIKEIAAAQQGVSAIEALAPKLNTTIDTATNISFASFQIPGAGPEQAIIAHAVNIDPNKISEPLEGNSGVFVIEVYNTTTRDEKTLNKALVQRQLIQTYRSRANYQAFEALKKLADVKDKRAKIE